MAAPLVSVLVPAYQAEAHLARALDSVLAQTRDDWELIVADDGSTDSTLAVAERYAVADPRIRVVRSRVNRGLAATRNLALAHARGPVVALLDSDDAWLPNYLEAQIALLDAERERGPVGIVCCDALLTSPQGPLPQTYSERFGVPTEPIDAAELLRGNTIFVSVLMPRAVVQAAGAFDPDLRSVEDLDLWLRIAERGYRIVRNPRPLAVYSIAPGTLSRDTLRMTRSRQRVYRAALQRGALDGRARRAAQRALRLERAAEIVELIRRSGRRRPVRAVAGLVIAAPLMIRVLLERRLRPAA
jgi:glycosyltransferase involved in cell wall biosynthesis